MVKSQSAMEYLMTYGWAILIVAVVLGALYSLGIFNGANFLGGTCIAAPGYLCSNPLLATDGTLSLTYGYQGPNVTVVGFACTNTTAAPASFTSWGLSNLEPGQEENISVSCPLSSSATIGTSYSGYLWVEYDQAGQSDLIARFATVRLAVNIQAQTLGSGSGSSYFGSASATLPSGYGLYFCAGEGENWINGYQSWTQDVGTAYSSIGYQTNDICSINPGNNNENEYMIVGAGVDKNSYAKYTNTGQPSVTGANHYTELQYSMPNSQASAVVFAACGLGNGLCTVLPPPGCAEEAAAASVNGNSSVFLCNGEPSGTYNVIVVPQYMFESPSVSIAAYVFDDYLAGTPISTSSATPSQDVQISGTEWNDQTFTLDGASVSQGYTNYLCAGGEAGSVFPHWITNNTDGEASSIGYMPTYLKDSNSCEIYAKAAASITVGLLNPPPATETDANIEGSANTLTLSYSVATSPSYTLILIACGIEGCNPPTLPGGCNLVSGQYGNGASAFAATCLGQSSGSYQVTVTGQNGNDEWASISSFVYPNYAPT